MEASVGPTAETANRNYGDAIYTPASRHLQPKQFEHFMPKVAQSSDDNGWIGPMGMYSMHSSAGSLYGYGVPSDNPQY
jgi:hypothetical protein